MKIQESAENYLETILVLQSRNTVVRSIDIANELNFTKASVSRAMKLLREANHITVNDQGHIALTSQGNILAKSIYEKHTILSEYLISIGVSEKVAFEDACRIEHVISNETFEKIRKLINK